MLEQLYPAGPADTGGQLAKASPAYRRHAWLAMFALLGFVAAYLLFSGWLAWKAYLSIRASVYGSRDAGLLMAVGLGAAFLAVFMLKALVFIRRGQAGGLTEITAAEQPGLFAFLYRLADEARAPRPAKVYLSSRVNAAVFYDLSLLNFFLPSKKNLEIGLPLVNVLTVSEFKAVLAHEFGHFAQRSMAVGRWVYLAQQIAGHIVAKRDKMDGFLEGLSRMDIRIAWIGWLFSLLVWAIRSVVDSLFRLVVLADRALSREMEFQADRVSVSLAGSDALIDALYRMQSADAAWDRALEFATRQLQKGKAAPDLYDIQSQILKKLRVIFDDPHYGVPPDAPFGQNRAAHRIFQRGKVSVSRMWATHPASHEREENAKKVYLQAQTLEASSWELFDQPLALRERLCAELISHLDPPPPLATREEALAALDAEYERESYKRRYRGVYLTRAVTRSEITAERLFDPMSAVEASAMLGRLYPESLSAELERLDALRHERAALEAVRDGIAKAEGPRFEHRGRPIKKRQLPGAVDEVQKDITEVEHALETHDRSCRSTMHALAALHGPEWESAWLGQLRLLHYAEHTEANLYDAHAMLANVVAMVTAKRKVSNAEAEQVNGAAGALFSVMAEVAKDAERLVPGAEVLALAGHDSWQELLGEFSLGYPARENLSQWLNVVDSWFKPMARALGVLKRAALDRLLLTEAALTDAAASREQLGAAPSAPVVPASYSALVTGHERPKQKKLDAWSRFQTADGWWAGAARFTVAGGLIASLMGVSTTLGTASVIAYNGLDREVKVSVGGSSATLSPGGHRSFEVEADKPIVLSARTTQGKGEEIESFSANPDLMGVRYVYNVASAAPLAAWTVAYGNATAPADRMLGAPRWSSQSADAIFEPPPKQIKTKGGGGTRSVISAPESRSTLVNLGGLTTDADRKAMIEAHSQWDPVESAFLLDWVMLAERELSESYPRIIAARLRQSPLEVMSLREQQELAADAADRVRVCERHRALADANPGKADLVYLVVRCIDDPAAKDQAFKKGAAQYPDNPWFAYAAGSVWAGEAAWPQARRAYEAARAKAPYFAGLVATDLARVRRIEQGETVSIDDLMAKSDYLRLQHALATGDNIESGSAVRAHVELARGRLDKAFELASAASPPNKRVLLYVGASDGANAKQVAKAVEIQQGVEAGDLDLMWPAIGLAIRQGRPVDKLLSSTRSLAPDDLQRLRAYVAVLQGSRDQRQADQALAGLAPQLRGFAYCIGLIALGDKAPTEWRSFVKRALFPSEHPYFG